MSYLLVLVLSLQKVVHVLQGLWILVNPAKIFPVVVFDQGDIFVTIRVHDKLHPKDSLLACSNKPCSFLGSEVFYFEVLLFAYYFDGSVPVRCVVELLNNLPCGLEIFNVRGEVHVLLFKVNEVRIGLPHSFVGSSLLP